MTSNRSFDGDTQVNSDVKRLQSENLKGGF